MWHDGGVTPEEAREAVRRKRSAVDEANAAAQQARGELHELLADIQDRKLLPQSELKNLAGYEREHLRRIKNEHHRSQQ